MNGITAGGSCHSQQKGALSWRLWVYGVKQNPQLGLTINEPSEGFFLTVTPSMSSTPKSQQCRFCGGRVSLRLALPLDSSGVCGW